MNSTLILIEAQAKMEEQVSTTKTMKSQLNQCALAKYKSAQLNDKFFLSYFNNAFEGGGFEGFKDISRMYNDTLSDDGFYSKLGYYLALYNPTNLMTIFNGLKRLIEGELVDNKKPLLYLNEAKASISFMRTKFEALFNTILPQVLYDVGVDKFKKAVLFSLDSISNDISKRISEITLKDTSMSAAMVKENLENDAPLIAKYTLHEGAIDKMKDKAKVVKVDYKKIEDAFDRNVTKVITDLRRRRQHEKHAQMVGESLRVSREIKRVFRSLPIALINPAVAAIVYISSIIIDKNTDADDRAVLIGDIRLEIKILEMKIETAERNGDEKEKIQLERAKDKLERTLERMLTNRTYYDRGL